MERYRPFFFSILQCRPVSYYWLGLYGTVHGSCLGFDGHNIGVGITNTFSDFALLMLPMPALWGLQMPVKRKVGLSVIFPLGIM